LIKLELHKVKTGKNKFENNSKSRSDNPSKSFRNSRDDRSSRYSRDDKGESATVTCADCGIECKVPFVPKTDKPVYCSDCFRQSKSQYSENDSYSSRDDRSSRYSRDDRSSRYSRDDRGESATVTCADCGIECKVPFVPKTDKPVYCSDCFRQSKSQYSENDSYSRAQDIPEMTEAQAEKGRKKDLNQKKNYLKNKKVSFLVGLKNSITH